MPIADFKTDTTVSGETPCALERSIWTWANAYKVSFSIFALNELGVFPLLAAEPLTAGELAARAGLHEELLSPLLELLAAAGVLTQSPRGFRAQQGIETILPLLAMEARLSASHVTSSQIAGVVRSGRAADIFQKGNVQEYLPVFTAAMRSSARTLAPHLLRFGNLRQCGRVLDLGGADGSLALALRRVAPHLQIQVVDLPRMREAFESRIRENGASEAIEFHEADLRRPEELTALLGRPEVIVISNVLHLLTTEQRLALYRKVRETASSGARFIIYDQYIDTEGPLSAGDFMAVDWVINGVRFRETPQQICGILESCGFVGAEFRHFHGLPGAVISVRK